jgi:hypothetical protein
MTNRTYDQLIARLRAVYHKAQMKTALLGAAKTVLCVCGVMFVVSSVEWALRTSNLWRFAILMLIVASAVSSLVWFLVLPFIKHRFNPDEIAKKVGDVFPALHDRLLNALQVFRQSPENPFAQIELRSVAERASSLNFVDTVRFDDSRKWLVVAPLCALFSLLLFLISPMGDALNRVVAFHEDFTPPPPFQIISLSKDIALTKGRDAELKFVIVPTDSNNFADKIGDMIYVCSACKKST